MPALTRILFLRLFYPIFGYFFFLVLSPIFSSNALASVEALYSAPIQVTETVHSKPAMALSVLTTGQKIENHVLMDFKATLEHVTKVAWAMRLLATNTFDPS